MDTSARLNLALEGRYSIEGRLGAGGMATVYLAHDLRHDRKVALKVLRPELAAVMGGDRFLAEIRTTANLQHPHILPLFDSGEADGFLFFVMPYVEGESLRERLDREGELPVEEAVRIATAVASALDYAHRHGVIHRDIKPANILLHDGQPQVADFGIALAVSVAGGGRLTETGLSLGTPYYMSPEQATAERDPDPRSDVYALGCVLYEMLVGEPPYTGSSAQAVLGKILTTEPVPLTEHRRAVPAHVEAVVLKALEKRPADRFSSAMEFSQALGDPRWVHDGSGVRRVPGRQRLKTSGLIVAGAILGALAMRAFIPIDGSVDAPPLFLPLSPLPGVSIGYDFGLPLVAISPDGRRLVYSAESGGLRRLYLQDLTTPADATPIPGTEGGASPFFSPDGRTLGFFAANALQVLALGSGEARQLAVTAAFGGGTFSLDGDTIYFCPDVDSGIWKVPVGGGAPVEVTTPRRDAFDHSHRFPEFLPDGRLMYTSAYGRFHLYVHDLATGVATPVLESETAFYGRYAPTGHIVFGQPGGVKAAAVDPRTLVTGEPFEVLADAVVETQGQANFAISRSGTLVFLQGISAFERTLTRIERDGTRRTLGTGGPIGISLDMDMAPDGDHVVLAAADGKEWAVFAYDLAREDLRPLVTHPGNDIAPILSRDGARIAFSSSREGVIDLYTASSDRTGEGTVLYASDRPKWPKSWYPDDTLLAFVQLERETRFDIWMYSFAADSVWPFRNGSEAEDWPEFSPDGRWIAYARGDAMSDVWVTPFPGPGPECKVSRGGGDEPRWSSDGAELYYRSGSTAMVADVADRDFCRAESRALFDGLEALSWTVAPDGSFFVTAEPRGESQLWLVQNWVEVLRDGGRMP